MRDVARLTGVSQSTVSRVLSGAASSVPIAAETRQRVQDAAGRLGYRPNPLARALRGAKTMLLGVIVREITDPFLAVAVEAISREARNRGYNVVLGTAHSRAEEAIALRAVLETRHCDALLLVGDMRDQPALLDDLGDAHVPVVGLWQGAPLGRRPMVNADNRAGIMRALDHLHELGHRRIALVGGEPFAAIHERRAAYHEWMADKQLTVPEGFLQLRPNHPAGGGVALDALLRLPDRPTAVVCTTDNLAIGVLHAASTHGIVVPRDLSVTGFDDLPISTYLVPALTTLRMPIAEMAAKAVAIAVDGGSHEGDVEVMQPRLIVRDSTAAPPRPPAPA